MKRVFSALLAWALLAGPAQAHLMVAQKGTLNFHGDGAYLVVSLPVSALKGVDTDGDGLLSSGELQANAAAVQRQIRAGVQLQAEGHVLPLELLLMTPSPPDDAPAAPAGQLVVLGRFALDAPAGAAAGAPSPRYVFTLALFGSTAAEQAHDITFTRQGEVHAARFSPSAQARPLFPTAVGVFAEQLRSGLYHVAVGLDHLIFLCVVLAEWALARRGWWRALQTLTAFTLGHAITLTWGTLGGWTPPPLAVEPAILATVVAMAALAWWQRWRGRWIPHRLQLSLVFGCALVHGLGLASALGNLGLVGGRLAWALAGFNLGVELAQLLVAAAVAMVWALRARCGPPACA